MILLQNILNALTFVRLSCKYPGINLCRTVTKYVFLITHAFEGGTVMVFSCIHGHRSYVPAGNLIS